MTRKLSGCLTILLLIALQELPAQRINYSAPFRSSVLPQYTVAGKLGNQYWVHKQQRKKRSVEEFLDIYNNHLEILHSVPAGAIKPSTLKKYFVCGVQYFDELTVVADNQQTLLQLRRYDVGGQLLADSEIARLPFMESGNGFILCCAQDKSKNLLLGFEPVTGSAPRMHAILFNSEWRTLSSLVFEQPFLLQPYIQDDFFCFPAAEKNAPVQLANNGEWLICAPSRISNNFLLLRFDGITTQVCQKEIKLPLQYKMEDIALHINNEKGEAAAAILSRYRFTALKNVHTTHYNFELDVFDFDSSYAFRSLPGSQQMENNLFRESFISIAGKGFMLLKEYGRTYTDWYQHFDEQPVSFENNTGTYPPPNANGYTRYSNTALPVRSCSRGDLSMFYFPCTAGDSCWTGFINKKQTTELNAPTLSYLIVPLPDKLALLYNNADWNNETYGSTLSIDGGGNALFERDLISWKNDQRLVFQQAVQIGDNEIAVPYNSNQQQGFAIIRF